ncbi:g2 mitotic-specific cyclin 3 [Stemphylium lycopersici]|uniref:G2 mitotic-specific cyclin 3 n=1 Tax=Stemphylium lycopersici TaxID=183478 RepID=A0A364NDY5_STELY|nr:g2 mitotic-specific cyclin 3 [Stemphylium lycopersici]
MIRGKDTFPPTKVKEKVTSEAARQPIKEEEKKKKKKKKKKKMRVPGEETQPEKESNSEKEKKPNTRNKKKQTGDMTQDTVAASYQKRDEAISAPVITVETRIKPEAAHIFVKGNRTAMDRTHELDRSLNDEYGNEVDEYKRSLEQRLKPDAFYMEDQSEINWSMRTVLVGWLIQIRMKLKLEPRVLCLAVNYLDRFLSETQVMQNKLQLAGCTALFIASKYELVSPIKKKIIVAIADGAFEVEELLQAESLMLKTLNFALGWPDPIDFLGSVEKADPEYRNTRDMSRCFLDITMIDQRFLDYVSSHLAAGAHCLARFMLKKNDWVSPSNHICYETY